MLTSNIVVCFMCMLALSSRLIDSSHKSTNEPSIKVVEGWPWLPAESGCPHSYEEAIKHLQTHFCNVLQMSIKKGFIPHPTKTPKGVLSYICILLIVNSDDVELNPGPKRRCKFPCGVCERAVKFDPQRPAICCDNCSLWYHKDCINMPSLEFSRLANTSVSWVCVKCNTPNYSMSLFDHTTIDTFNSFQPLHDMSSVAVPRSSISSFTSSNIGSPVQASSPRPNAPKGGTSTNRSLKTVVVNIRSITAKKEVFWEMLSTSQPDIIIGCETWLAPSISNSEVLPANYTAFRTDRADGYGGVLVGVSNDIIAEQLETPNDSELTAIKVNLVAKQPLIIIGAYRLTNNEEEYKTRLTSNIRNIILAQKNATIWCAGDFNVPDIDWVSESIKGKQYPLAVNDQVLNLVHECNFEQMVDFPTRDDNTLDLFMTNRPSLVNRCEPMPGISDHEAVYVDSNIIAKRQKQVRRKIFLWKRADIENLKSEIRDFTTEFIESNTADTPVNTLWSCISNKLEEVMEKYVPSKMTSTCYNQPWVTSKIKSIERQKQKCYIQMRRHNSQ